MNFEASADFAAKLDRSDPLSGYRAQFHIPRHGDHEAIYLCGNSLGLQPKSTARYLEEELAEWKNLAVHAHTAGRRPWLPYHELLSEKTAQVVGAKPAEVVNMNSLTANLHLMLVSFFRPNPTRNCILMERGAFPSDRYAVVSQLHFHGLDPRKSLVELMPQNSTTTLDSEGIEGALSQYGERIALVLLPGVQYYSGQAFDMARITHAAHRAGALIGFDLAHATGNLLLQLHDWNVDFAVWCNYKYMNGGPGAVAGCFVHERHLGKRDLPRFTGWWGSDKDTRFKMQPDFAPIPTAESWQLSNPPILALAPVLASLEIFSAVGMPALREKSIHLTGYMGWLLKQRLAGRVEIITPSDPEARGCQLSLRLIGSNAAARATFTRLEAASVVSDWREPDVIRVAPVPLYNSYADVYQFVEILVRVMDAG